MTFKSLIVLSLVQWMFTTAGAQNDLAPKDAPVTGAPLSDHLVRGDGIAKTNSVVEGSYDKITGDESMAKDDRQVQADSQAQADMPDKLSHTAKLSETAQDDHQAQADSPDQAEMPAKLGQTAQLSQTAQDDHQAQADSQAQLDLVAEDDNDARTDHAVQDDRQTEADSVHEAFLEMDANQDGSLTLDEYAGLHIEDMSKEELEKAKGDVKLMFDEVDKDKSGALSKEEFQKAEELENEQNEANQMTALGEVSEQDADVNMDAWQAAMNRLESLDTDKDGLLSLKEFVAEQADMFDEDEEQEKDELMKEMEVEFQDADKNQDGKLSPEELQKFTKGDDEGMATYEETAPQ